MDVGERIPRYPLDERKDMDSKNLMKMHQSRHEIILWDEFETGSFSYSFGAKSRMDRKPKARVLKAVNRFHQKELKVKNPKMAQGQVIVESDQGL
ncbi:MAG TPA: hypothetical protein VGA79_03770 [Desulfobaccales bacterium]